MVFPWSFPSHLDIVLKWRKRRCETNPQASPYLLEMYPCKRRNVKNQPILNWAHAVYCFVRGSWSQTSCGTDNDTRISKYNSRFRVVLPSWDCARGDIILRCLLQTINIILVRFINCAFLLSLAWKTKTGTFKKYLFKIVQGYLKVFWRFFKIDSC